MQSHWLNTLQDIRLWIAILFLIRLPGAFWPPIEVHHGWRQATTLMTVRAMEEHGPDFLHPGTAVPGPDRPNIIASEFPIYNFLIWLNVKSWDAGHGVGRFISLLASAVGIWCFYLILLRIAGRDVAFPAALILLVSVWFMFSRKIMPDVFACSLALAGVECLWRFRVFGRVAWLVAGGVLVALGILSKLPAAVLLVFLIPLLLDPGASGLRRFSVVCVTALSAGLAGWWYFIWIPELIDNGAYQLYWTKSFTEGFGELAARPFETLHRFTFSAFYSYTAFVCILIGIPTLARESRALRISAGATLFLLVFYMLRVGDCIPEHDYYLIPFIPFFAMVAAVGLQRIAIRQWAGIVVLVAILIEGIANQQHDLRWPAGMAYKLKLADELNALIPTNEPVAFVSDLNPSDMYFANRNGWLVSQEDLNNADVRQRLMNGGCRFVVVNSKRPRLSNFRPDLPMHAEGEVWRIFSLEANTSGE